MTVQPWDPVSPRQTERDEASEAGLGRLGLFLFSITPPPKRRGISARLEPRAPTSKNVTLTDVVLEIPTLAWRHRLDPPIHKGSKQRNDKDQGECDLKKQRLTSLPQVYEQHRGHRPR